MTSPGPADRRIGTPEAINPSLENHHTVEPFLPEIPTRRWWCFSVAMGLMPSSSLMRRLRRLLAGCLRNLLDNACLPYQGIPTTIFKVFIYWRIAKENVEDTIEFIHCCIKARV